MSIPYYGDFAEDDTVQIPFNTFSSNDPSASVTVTDCVNTDVHIHKDGAVAQRNNAAGITMSVNFDGITGNHLVTIDTSDDTVAGFWVTGSEYQVRLEGITVDAATLNVWIGTFSIERAGGVLALLKGGSVDVNTKTITAGIIANASFNADVGSTPHGTNIIALAVRKILEELNLDHLLKVVTAAADMTTEVADNTIVSRMLANGDTSAFVPSTDGLQLIRDVAPHGTAMRGTDGANTTVPDAAGVAPTVAEIQAEMEENGASILDTLRDDLADGGRLDLLIDGIKAKTDNLPADPADDSDIDSQLAIIAAYLDTEIAAIKGKTDNLPASPAAVGSEMGLANDAITAAKYDESTAFPVKSDDSGATQIARVGADGDTLETLSDQVDAVSAGDATAANQTTILSRIGAPANIDSGGASLAENIKKIADDNAGASFDATNHSLAALRTRGDAAWITGGGGSLTEILNIQPLIPNSIDLANTVTVRIGLGLTNMLDNLPSTAEITPGTITIDHKAFGGTSWTNVVNAAACSELAGLVYYEEVFDSGTGYAQGDSIRITFKNQKITVAANDYEITGSDGWPFQTYIRDPLLTLTGITAGGTLTGQKLLKLLSAQVAGNWRVKSGETNIFELLDADDGSTVIVEMQLSQTTPYRTMTLKI
jgi:hypothetical protein